MDSQHTEDQQLLDKYFCPTVRKNLEQDFYEKMNARAKLGEALKDSLFLANPLKHPSLMPDHGLVHVRDIAFRMLSLLEQLNGIHFAKRNSARLEFMKGYGVMLAYVHDIGMLDVYDSAHEMHTQASAQMIYNDYFDQQISALWEENSGNVAWRITRLSLKKAFSQPPKHILREMLALAGAHARTPITTEMLNHPAELRRAMQEMLAYQLQYQWLQSQVADAEKRLHAAETLDDKQRDSFVKAKTDAETALDIALSQHKTSAEINTFLKLYYENFWDESFQWLITDNPEGRELVDDVIDTIRTLRCANASRQRGARLRATGEHQIFLDHHSANAIYAINANQKLYLLESKDTLLAGEVNLSSTEFTQAGDLRISFYRGHFIYPEANERASFNAAVAINEVQLDMVESFARPAAGNDNSSADYAKKWKPVYILLENCNDNPDFATQVQKQLTLLNPKLKNHIRVVPSLQNASEQERNRYLAAEELAWDLRTKSEMLEKIAKSGHKTSNMQAQHAFNHVKCAEIHAGEILMQAGTLASFVYVPLNEGLTGYPLGGYQSFRAQPFIPLGNTSVIRGDIRNATLVADASVKVMIIPSEVYEQYWHTTYSEQEFIQLIHQNQSVS